jgi:hypothetical protein
MAITVYWPEIRLQCRMDASPNNQNLYDWFSSGLPYESVQGHAVVSGDLLYTKNIHVPQTTYNYDELHTELLTEAPVGRVFINVSRGDVGTIMIKYSEAITEDMPYPIIGQIREEDLHTIKEVGDIIWHGYYHSKVYSLCRFMKEK